MSMNKKEIAAFEAMKAELMLLQALRWTAPIAPDLPAPAVFKDLETSGFVFNAYSGTVQPAWSHSVVHGTGYASSQVQKKAGSSATQQGRDLYSTRLLALRAMRYAVERECARKLAGIDAQIEAESSPTPATKP